MVAARLMATLLLVHEAVYGWFGHDRSNIQAISVSSAAAALAPGMAPLLPFADVSSTWSIPQRKRIASVPSGPLNTMPVAVGFPLRGKCWWDRLRAFARRVDVGKAESRIMGSKGELLRTLAAVSSEKSAGIGVPILGLKWRCCQSNANRSPHDAVRSLTSVFN